jgi:hypothetical protein
MSPFDWVNSINNKSDIGNENIDSYAPFIINRAMSYFDDTVLIANEMNLRHSLDKDMQYRFLYATVTKRKRFAKWAKKQEDTKVSLVSRAYNISVKEAESYMPLLSDEQLKEIEHTLEKGGLKK